jgi:FkbM family methyltransferase
VTLNRLKKAIRSRLPIDVLSCIQFIRKRIYDQDPGFEARRLEFERLQQSQATTNDELVLRPGLALRVHAESFMPFSWFCWHSPDMVAELDLFIALAAGARTFADVGANHGIFSLVFLKLNPNGRVLSVDPSPIADEIRKVNRKLNGQEDSMLCHQVACGAEEGSVLMHSNWHHLEASGTGDHGLEPKPIPVRPLDALCDESEFKPEIIKIDVEGLELQVLHGAEASLKHARFLLLEVHPELLEKLSIPLRDIFDWLDTRGWRIQTLRRKEMTRAEFCDQLHTFWTVCEPEIEHHDRESLSKSGAAHRQ